MVEIGRFLRKHGGAIAGAAILVAGTVLWFSLPDEEKARNPAAAKLLLYPAVAVLSVGAAGLVRLYRWVWPDQVTLAQLVEEPRPRSPGVVATAVRIYVVRHTLPRMGVWLLLTVPIAALVLNGYVIDVGLGDPNVTGSETLARFGIACAIVTPVQLAQFALYAVRRGRQLARVARDGELVPAHVTAVQVAGRVRSEFRLGDRRARIDLTVIGAGSASYAFELAVRDLKREPRWAAGASGVRAVVSGRDRFAIVLSPEGREHFAHRVRRWREILDELRVRRALPGARARRAHEPSGNATAARAGRARD